MSWGTCVSKTRSPGPYAAHVQATASAEDCPFVEAPAGEPLFRTPPRPLTLGLKRAARLGLLRTPPAPPPVCDIPSGCCSFTGPWTVTRSSLRMLRRVATFCRPLRPVLLLVSFPRSRSPVVGELGLCWMWQDVPFARQRPPPPRMPGNAAHHRRVTLGDQEPPEPVLHFPHRMCGEHPPNATAMGID